MLELRNVSKLYGDSTALSPVSLSFEKQVTTVLIGPSGCGKSTLLRIIAGLISPDTGSVYFNGSRVGAASIQQFRHKMGYVIQEGGLFPHLTVRQNVVLVAAYIQWPKSRIEQRFSELMRLVQLPPELAERFPMELSGGQRQRVSIMRALMLDPDLILMDEPLGALDPIIRFQLQRELKTIFQQLKKTVIMVTHDLAEAAFFGEHIVFMRDGAVIQQGTFQSLVKSPAEEFVSQFITAQQAPLEQLSEAIK